MATYWENSCSFGLRCVSWYKYLIVGLVFSHLGFWSGSLFLIAPFPDLCLLVPFHNEPKLVGVKMFKGRCYYNIQKGNAAPECQPTTMAHWHARKFITYLVQYVQADMEECKIRVIRDRYNSVPRSRPEGVRSILCDSVHEVCIQENGTIIFLVSYRSLHLPPDWYRLEDIPTGTLNQLIDFMRTDYHAAIGKRIN